MQDEFLDEAAVARLIGRSVCTVSRMVRRGNGDQNRYVSMKKWYFGGATKYWHGLKCNASPNGNALNQRNPSND
jgi:hypothetical protein